MLNAKRYFSYAILATCKQFPILPIPTIQRITIVIRLTSNIGFIFYTWFPNSIFLFYVKNIGQTQLYNTLLKIEKQIVILDLDT